mgnify:CR=1 FL=1
MIEPLLRITRIYVLTEVDLHTFEETSVLLTGPLSLCERYGIRKEVHLPDRQIILTERE